MEEEKKTELTEIATFHGGSVKITMSLANLHTGGQAPAFTIYLADREELPPNTITMGELAMLSELIKVALHQSVSMCSTVAGDGP